MHLQLKKLCHFLIWAACWFLARFVHLESHFRLAGKQTVLVLLRRGAESFRDNNRVVFEHPEPDAGAPQDHMFVRAVCNFDDMRKLSAEAVQGAQVLDLALIGS